MNRLARALISPLILAAPLASCGKKGSLEAPASETVSFPRQYPSKRPVVVPGAEPAPTRDSSAPPPWRSPTAPPFSR